MALTVTLNGVQYSIPEPNDASYGAALDSYLKALATGLLPTGGGAAALTAEIDLGASFGVKALYLKTETANPAAAGVVRLAKTDAIKWRNNANGADIAVGIDTVDHLQINGISFRSRITPVYGPSITIDASAGDWQEIIVTNATAFTINAPTNPLQGVEMTITIKNASGGAMGVITWNAVFKMSAWTNPANANNRSITFGYDGVNWKQLGQTGVDVPN